MSYILGGIIGAIITLVAFTAAAAYYLKGIWGNF